MSERLLPEAVNFVATAVLILVARRKAVARPSYPDRLAPDANLSITPNDLILPEEPINLSTPLRPSDSPPPAIQLEQSKVNLLAVALRLVETYATLYSSSQAFVQLFAPVLSILERSKVAKLSQPIKAIHSSTTSTISRMITHALAARRPLAMQAHKPIPIASYAPRFEDDFAPGRHYDPDTERNSTAKVKALYKKERKGAIRELRKDNRFLAGEKAREQQVKDSAYKTKMRRVEGEINMERAEEKAMQR